MCESTTTLGRNEERQFIGITTIMMSHGTNTDNTDGMSAVRPLWGDNLQYCSILDQILITVIIMTLSEITI